MPRIDWRRTEFLLGTSSPGEWPRHRAAEIAFVGRSNVGKSSLLNALTGKKSLSRVSKTPGCTRQILFFPVTPGLCLVDLPGYGYARRGGEEREAWGKHIEKYLEDRENLRLLVLLVDSRHEPTPLDRALLEYAARIGRPLQIVLTKVDVLSGNERMKALRRAAESLPGGPLGAPLAVSAKTGEGMEELRGLFEETARSR
ncbi:MAG: ribosome biogenesis GTP-binding protein YihA/YsxC [Bdellovibrionota bacterium]